MSVSMEYIKELIGKVEEQEAIIEKLQQGVNNNTSNQVMLLQKQLDEEASQNRTYCETITSLKEEVNFLKGKLTEIPQEEKDEVQRLKRELKSLQENMRKPAIIETVGADVIQIFKDIKEGHGCIQPLTPTVGEWKKLKTYPFTFELGKMGCVFEACELKGCFEREGSVRKYYYNAESSAMVNREIILQLLGLNLQNKESLDCKIVTKTSSKRGKKFPGKNLMSLLKLNPQFDVKKQRFLSTKDVQFVYTHRDGSKYLIRADDGEEEIL